MSKQHTKITKNIALILAHCAWATSVLSANSICGIPFYHVKPPEELEKLKKHKPN